MLISPIFLSLFLLLACFDLLNSFLLDSLSPPLLCSVLLLFGLQLLLSDSYTRHCHYVQLSVRGCSPSYVLLEGRLVKTCTDLYMHMETYHGDRVSHSTDI